MNVVVPSVPETKAAPQAAGFLLPQTEAGYLKLLVTIRGSILAPEEKINLRDLVLEVSQASATEKKQKEATLLEALKQYNQELGLFNESSDPVEETAQKATAEPISKEPVVVSEKSSVGRRRPRPQFAHTTAIPASSETVEVETSVGKLPSVTETPEKTASTVPAEPEESTSSTQVVEEVSTADPMARIQEIKKSVNSRVGNPVNLIDADNTIGREYMNALLEAMKKASGGTDGGELATAMKRLEEAYLAVDQLLHKESVGAPQQSELDSSATKPTNDKSNPVSGQKTETTVDVATKPNSAVQPSVDVQASPSPETKDVTQDAPGPLPSVLDTLKKTDGATPKVDEQKTQVPVRTMQSDAQVAKTSPSAVPTQTTLKPVSEVETLPEKMTTLKKVLQKQKDEQKNKVITDLEAPEITAGLTQLLAEWKLFKSSGIFGTGPSGVEHPLYKQLAQVPMAAVVAGRFEGSTPEIRQSITDYMNGWRYEQGIVHEMNETFEHYLRRVILHIIKRQKQTSAA